jgi:hypothetical protein
MTAQAYKFQAFVTLNRPDSADSPGRAGSGPVPIVPSALPPGLIQRMTVRAQHHDTHGTHYFPALVANYGDSAEWIGPDHAIVTIRLYGDDPADYFSAGDHFALWLGHDIADGVVTRRLIV